METCFEILMKMINGSLKILNSKGYFLRNPDDKDFYINEIYYDREDDELYCNFIEG